MRFKFYGLLILSLIGILALSGCISDSECSNPGDCRGDHGDCPGQWKCIEGKCVWVCTPQQSEGCFLSTCDCQCRNEKDTENCTMDCYKEFGIAGCNSSCQPIYDEKRLVQIAKNYTGNSLEGVENLTVIKASGNGSSGLVLRLNFTSNGTPSSIDLVIKNGTASQLENKTYDAAFVCESNMDCIPERPLADVDYRCEGGKCVQHKSENSYENSATKNCCLHIRQS